MAAFLVLIIIIFRLYQIQVNATDCFYFNKGSCKENILKVAEKRQIHSVKLTAQRGSIYDRNNNVLAMSLPIKTLCINPSRLYKSNNKSILELSHDLGLSEKKLKQIIQKNKNKKEFYLKRHISKDFYLKIKNSNNPNLYFINENKRSYLGGKAFSNIIGFTNIDDKGQEGIEFISNKILLPEHGLKKVKKDNIGRPIETIGIIRKPVPGQDIFLTLDKRIQIIAYETLRKYITKFKAESGSIILIESNTGDIMSMTNYPSFNPDRRSEFRGKKIKNRAVYDLIEPGSTIKPLIIYYGLHNEVISESTIINTAPGVIQLEDKEIKDWKYLGKVSPRDIIKLSSNIGAAKVSSKLSKKQLIDGLNELGFGQSLFLNLPGSKTGSLPLSSELSNSGHMSLGYGYGLSTSLMHLASAYTTLANYGNRVQINYLKNNNRDIKKDNILNRDNSIKVLDMMRDVVHSKDGTGRRAKVEGYTVYGKTGTVRQIINGKYAKHKHNALFVGIVGDPKPKYVAAVIVRSPKNREGSGGYHAAPVFSEFMQHSMRILDDMSYVNNRQ
jgi:cell division protein FtsI (penicillin-binding protein 3)